MGQATAHFPVSVTLFPGNCAICVICTLCGCVTFLVSCIVYCFVDPVSLSLPILSLCMSGPRRRVDIDYKVWNNTGRKVPKDRAKEHKMAGPELSVQALNIGSDIEDFHENYNIDNLTEEDELSEYLSKIGETKIIFRRIYTQSKTIEGESFIDKYPYYDT